MEACLGTEPQFAKTLQQPACCLATISCHFIDPLDATSARALSALHLQNV